MTDAFPKSIAALSSQPVFASVVAVSLRGFDGLPVAAQAESKAALDSLVEASVAPLPAPDRIVLEAPGGAVIVSFASPADVLEVAERLQQRASAALSACVALNHGPVVLTRDADERDGIVGDGIAAAMTLAGAAEPGRMLVARAFQEALAATGSPRIADLQPAGRHTDAAWRSHDLFTVDAMRGAAARRRRFLLTGAGVFGIVCAGVIGRVLREDEPPRPAFVQLSIRPRGEVFVDGEKRGTTPPLTVLELPPGEHAIEIRSAGYAPHRVSVKLMPDEKITVTHAFVGRKKDDGARRKPGS
jgi:hypothetical protein